MPKLWYNIVRGRRTKLHKKILEYNGYSIIDDGFGYQAIRNGIVAFYAATTDELIRVIEEDEDEDFMAIITLF